MAILFEEEIILLNIEKQMINKYLEKIKIQVKNNEFTFVESREKNAKFMRDNGFIIEDIKDIL